MKKVITGAALFGAALAALRRFGPALHERAAKKCQQMMSKCGEMFAQPAGTAPGKTETSAATQPAERADTSEQEPASAASR